MYRGENYFLGANLLTQPVPETVKVHQVYRPDHNRWFVKSRTTNWGSPQASYEAYSPKIEGLLETIVVAREPNHKQQRIIAPSWIVPDICLAFQILDNLFPNNNFRDIDTVVGAFVEKSSHSKEPYRLPKRGKLFNDQILRETGIAKILEGAQGVNYKVPKGNLPRVTCLHEGLVKPIYFTACFPFPLDTGERVKQLIWYISTIPHEWTHWHQTKNKLPYHIGMMERQALTNQALVLKLLLHTPLGQNEEFRNEIYRYLAHKIDPLILDYRSGGLGHRKKRGGRFGGDSYVPRPDDPDFQKFKDYRHSRYANN